MLEFRGSVRARTAFVTSLFVWLLAGSTASVRAEDAAKDPSLLQAIDTACTDAEKALDKAAKENAWPLPEACKKKDDVPADAAACRRALQNQLVETVRAAVGAQVSATRQKLLPTIEKGRTVDQSHDLYSSIGTAAEGLVPKVTASLNSGTSPFDKFEPAQADAETQAGAISKNSAVEEAQQFGRMCRQDLAASVKVSEQFREQLKEIKALSDSIEDAHVADLTKQSGFSQIVRCRWLRGTEAPDRLDCTPGLRVGGEDASAILIEGPTNDPEFGLAWVQAVTAEETRRTKSRLWGNAGGQEQLSCPNHKPGDPRSLTCDELWFNRMPCSKISGCGDAERSAAFNPSTAEIAVHMPRWLGTSYGCWTSSQNCALRHLRGEESTLLEREKLSLVIRGKTPVIVVKAMDKDGHLAAGEVLVGYERWHLETGGFMGVVFANGTDDELVTEPVAASSEGEDAQVKITAIRESDDYAQETGVFVNLIPRNYEALGIGLGFSVDDGQAPSVYLGPAIRLTSFGHRGLAALTAGVVMRQVDRFPGLEVGDLLDTDSASLQPDSRFEFAPYVGIQLGFSFGPISVPSEE